MLYAGSSWSELPLSTSKEQELSGGIICYELLTDGVLEIDLEIQTFESVELFITQQIDFSVYTNTKC
jgi:hypothetical protein